jgi:hypothetical protein
VSGYFNRVSWAEPLAAAKAATVKAMNQRDGDMEDSLKYVGERRA